MQSAIPAQELPVRSALTVGVRCVNRTRKHAASVMAYSVLRACPSIQCSTPKLHQQTTGKFGNEKLPEPRHLEPRPLKEFTCVLILARHLPQHKPSETEILMDVK